MLNPQRMVVPEFLGVAMRPMRMKPTPKSGSYFVQLPPEDLVKNPSAYAMHSVETMGWSSYLPQLLFAREIPAVMMLQEMGEAALSKAYPYGKWGRLVRRPRGQAILHPPPVLVS
jgi:hypothetical protein